MTWLYPRLAPFASGAVALTVPSLQSGAFGLTRPARQDVFDYVEMFYNPVGKFVSNPLEIARCNWSGLSQSRDNPSRLTTTGISSAEVACKPKLFGPN